MLAQMVAGQDSRFDVATGFDFKIRDCSTFVLKLTMNLKAIYSRCVVRPTSTPYENWLTCMFLASDFATNLRGVSSIR